MVGIKKRSKRTSLLNKYKAQKKIKEHHRKLKRAAKKSGELYKKKNPYGELRIPNNFPGKEDELLKVERYEAAMKAEKERLVINRKAELQRKKAAARREREHVESMIRHKELQQRESGRQKIVDTIIEKCDVVLEILDARDPISGRIQRIEEQIKSHESKQLVIVLNKIDLVPVNIAKKWLKRLRQEFPTVIFKSALTEQMLTEKKTVTKTSRNAGANTLKQILRNMQAAADKNITVGVVGYPMVGKRSVLSSLQRTKNIVKVESTSLTEEFQLDSKIRLMITPGVVLDEGQERVSFRSINGIKTVEDPIFMCLSLLSRGSETSVCSALKCSTYNGDLDTMLANIAITRGKLAKGGKPNIRAGAKSVIQDWIYARIPIYTKVPKEPVEEPTPADFGDFDIDANDSIIFQKVAENAPDMDSCLALNAPDLSQFDIVDEEPMEEEEVDIDEEDMETADESEQESEPEVSKAVKKSIEYKNTISVDKKGRKLFNFGAVF
eukprot:TRINITY_DN1914_c0_g1_i1.p1 TRINITY_DN1914_c0_g1~~TRINITY_DN1914_c0_g1_i1.p1  ORF type:complete len:521 (-),score=194.40 TRINITY_DN1914_c0_g1_i1:170-1657(-)